MDRPETNLLPAFTDPLRSSRAHLDTAAISGISSSGTPPGCVPNRRGIRGSLGLDPRLPSANPSVGFWWWCQDAPGHRHIDTKRLKLPQALANFLLRADQTRFYPGQTHWAGSSGHGLFG